MAKRKETLIPTSFILCGDLRVDHMDQYPHLTST